MIAVCVGAHSQPASRQAGNACRECVHVVSVSAQRYDVRTVALPQLAARQTDRQGLQRWYGTAWYMAWHGIWYGIWHGIWHGMVWYGMSHVQEDGGVADAEVPEQGGRDAEGGHLHARSEAGRHGEAGGRRSLQ
jgi:hypothetical protein